MYEFFLFPSDFVCYHEMLTNVREMGEKSCYRRIGPIIRRTSPKADEFVSIKLVKEIGKLERALIKLSHRDYQLTTSMVGSLLHVLGDLQIVTCDYDWITSELDRS